MLSEKVLLLCCNKWLPCAGRGPVWMTHREGSIPTPLWFCGRGNLHTDRAAMGVYPLTWAALLLFWRFHPMICNFVPRKFPLPFRFGEETHLQPLCFVRALSPAPGLPCPSQPWALPSQAHTWADILPWPWPWPVPIWGAQCLGLGLGLPPAALLLPGAAGRAWPARPCPASRLPPWAPAPCPWGSSRPALCPGSACGNTAGSSSSVTWRRRAVYRYGAHSPFFCVTGTGAASSALTGRLCGWPRAGRTFTAWAVKGLACHSF